MQQEAESSIEKKRMYPKSYREKVPDDIIHDIFLRLPPKTLLRFRSISKYWCHHVIDSIPFANINLSARATAADEPQLLQLPLRDLRYAQTVHSFTFDGSVFKESDEHPLFEFSNKFCGYIDDHLHIVFGLLLFQSESTGELYLCNSLRGEVLELPRPSLSLKKSSTFHCNGIGIGFDSKTNSYKIVHVRTINGKFGIEIYTLGSRSWRLISTSVLDDKIISSAVYAYGDMHCQTWDCTKKEPCIVTFDFETEEFKDTPLPDSVRQAKHHETVTLINWKGRLAAVSFPSVKRIEIWVLKDYKKNQWVREFKINNRRLYARDSENNIVRRRDLYFWNDARKNLPYHLRVYVCGKWLVFTYLRKGSPYYFLDPETNLLMYQKSPDCEVFKQASEVFSFTGSVLSLRHFGNQKAKIPLNLDLLKPVHRFYVSPGKRDT